MLQLWIVLLGAVFVGHGVSGLPIREEKIIQNWGWKNAFDKYMSYLTEDRLDNSNGGIQAIIISRSISDERDEVIEEPVDDSDSSSEYEPKEQSVVAVVAVSVAGTLLASYVCFLVLRFLYDTMNRPGNGYMSIDHDEILPGPAKAKAAAAVAQLSKKGTALAHEVVGKLDSAKPSGGKPVSVKMLTLHK